MLRESVYWYAPFDNAGELLLASAISPKLSGKLVVQSCSSRFGEDLAVPDGEPFSLVRDLPPPVGESGDRRSTWRRWQVAHDRTVLRRRLIGAEDPSLIHLHTYNPFTDWYDAHRLRRRGVPVIQSIHNVRPHDRQLPGPIETLLLRRGYRAFDRLIVAHEHLATRLVDEFEVDPGRVDVVPLPINSRDFVEGHQIETDPSVTTFLFFGTFRQNKGIDRYLHAIDALSDDASLRFVFAGRGDAELENMVLEHQLRDHRITAEIGYVSARRRAELYGSADVVVMPYVDLPAQSGVLQDAYASGRPVIASDVGALGPAIKSDRTGWVVEPRNQGALVRALRAAAAQPAERASCAITAHRIASTRTPDHIADQICEVYERALRDPRGGDSVRETT